MATSTLSLCCAIVAALLAENPVLGSRSNPLRAGLSQDTVVAQARRNQWTRKALLAVQKRTNSKDVAQKVQAAAQWAQLRHTRQLGGSSEEPSTPGPPTTTTTTTLSGEVTGAAPAAAPAPPPGASAPGNFSVNATGGIGNVTNVSGVSNVSMEPSGPNYTAIMGEMDLLTYQAEAAAMTADDMVSVIEGIPPTIENAETGEAAKAANREAKRALRTAKESYLNVSGTLTSAQEIYNNTIWDNVTIEDQALENIEQLKGIKSETKEAWLAAKGYAEESKNLAITAWEEDAPNRKERKHKRAQLLKKLKKKIQDQFWAQKWEKEDKMIAMKKKHCTAFAKCKEEDAIEWADTQTFKVVPETETPWYKKAMKQLKERNAKKRRAMPNITGAPGGAPGAPGAAPMGAPGFAPATPFALPLFAPAPAPPGSPGGAGAPGGDPDLGDQTLNITLPPGRKVMPPIINGMSMIGPIFPPGIRCKPPPLAVKGLIKAVKGNLGWGGTERECKVKCLETVNCSYAVYYNMYQSEESLAYEKAQLQAQRDQIRYNAEYKEPPKRKLNYTYSTEQRILGLGGGPR